MRWILLCALVGCVDPGMGTSSDTETCAGSPLSFVHDQGPYGLQKLAIAEGGRAELSLKCILGDLPGEAPWDVPSSATSSSDAVTANESGSTLSIHGVHEGTASVAIVASDGRGYGSIEITVAPVDHLAFRGTYDDVPANVEVAFAKEFGTLDEVELASSTGTVLIDDDMVVTPPAGATLTGIRPGVVDIAAMPVGDGTIAVDSGGAMHSAPFSVVDHADAIALVDSHAMVPSGSSTVDVCFAATLGTKFVTGLRWSYVYEDGLVQGGSNCEPTGSADDTNHDGKVTFATSAGGVSAQIDIPIH